MNMVSLLAYTELHTSRRQSLLLKLVFFSLGPRLHAPVDLMQRRGGVGFRWESGRDAVGRRTAPTVSRR